MRLPSLCLPILAAFGLSLGGCAGAPSPPAATTDNTSLYKHLAAYEAQVDANTARDIISTYRHNHGLATVNVDPVLEQVAKDQVLAMARADRLSHTVHGSLVVRLDNVGMQNKAAVENVSAGYDTLADAFAGWRASPPHDANMLNPAMRRMGIATAYAPGSRYKVYWALVMTD